MTDCVERSNRLHSEWVAQEITPRRSAGSEIPVCISETEAALTLYKDNCRAARDSRDIKINKFNKANRLITAWLQIIRDYRSALTGIVPETGVLDPDSTIQFYFGGPEWGGMDIPEVNGVSETGGSEFCIQPKLPKHWNNGWGNIDSDLNLNTEYKECRSSSSTTGCLDKRLPGTAGTPYDSTTSDEYTEPAYPTGGYNNRIIKQHMCINMGVSTLFQGGNEDNRPDQQGGGIHRYTDSNQFAGWIKRSDVTPGSQTERLPDYPIIPGHTTTSEAYAKRILDMARLCTKNGESEPTTTNGTLTGTAGLSSNPIYCDASYSRPSGLEKNDDHQVTNPGMCLGLSNIPMPESRIYRCSYNNTGLDARLNEFSRTDIAKGKFIDAIENLHTSNEASEVSSSEEYKQYFVEKYNESLQSDGIHITLADLSRNQGEVTATEWDADVTKIQGILADADLDTPEWQQDPAGRNATNRGLSLRGGNYGNWQQHTSCPDEKCPLVAVTQAMPNCCQNTINVSGDDINLEDINQSCGIETDDSGSGSSGGSSGGSSEVALRAELSAMGLTALLARAASSGVPGNLLDDIDDREDPKAATIDLIVGFEEREDEGEDEDEPSIWQRIVNSIRELFGFSEGFTVNKIDNKSYTTNPMLFIFLVILMSFIFINKNKIIKKFKQMLN